MISEESIQRVREQALVEEVIADFVELKRSGATFKGLSPFVTEKTPSFMVSPAKQIWKCFSSGKGGAGAISFMMDYKGMTYPEAIGFLAERYNVQLDYEKGKEQSEEEKSFKERCEKVLRFAAGTYKKKLAVGAEDLSPALKYLTVNRGLSEDAIIEWELGYAPDAWDTLKQSIIDKGFYTEAEHLGLVKTSKGHTYDFFRNRIVFPIHNHAGYLVGFGSRKFAEDDETAKYLNSKASDFYDKSKVLYGLHQASEAIRKKGLAYLTEGYMDVIAMHQADLKNTVATCGTALTPQHVKLLKRYTNHVVIIRDADPAGLRAAMRDVELLLQEDFRVEVCSLPDGEDPDSLCRKMTQESLAEN